MSLKEKNNDLSLDSAQLAGEDKLVFPKESEGEADINFEAPPQELLDFGKELEQLMEEYIRWASGFTASLIKLIKTADLDREQSSLYVNQMTDNVKTLLEVSQAMNYPMVVAMSNSLLHFLHQSYAFNDISVEMILAHFRGMRFILHEEVDGFSDITGRKLIARLEEEVASVLKYNTS